MAKSTREVREKRREIVATLLARGMTQAEILQQISSRTKTDGSPNPTYMINPRTGKPYNKSTISRDVDHIRRQWQTSTMRSAEAWLSEEVAALKEARRMAWANKDYGEVRKSVESMAKLLGLNKPEVFEHRFDDDQLEQIQSARESLVSELESMAERLQSE